MISSVPLTKSYHELIEMIVCHRENKQCLIHRCPNCPGIEALQYLKVLLLLDDNEDDEQDEIAYVENQIFVLKPANYICIV